MRRHKKITIMEVCGTHTMSIARYGLRQRFPKEVALLSGPGCPVCVTPIGSIDAAIALANQPGVIITTFGDMIRVPGSRTNLEKERAAGADIRIVYSPIDALAIAQSAPCASVVFLGVGFETTAPAIAATIQAAHSKKIHNFSVLPMFKTVPQALRAILAAKNRSIDAFLLPGHVSAIIGLKPYSFLIDEFHVPGVVAGFESNDILSAVETLTEQVRTGTAVLTNGYSRVVQPNGNPTAQRILAEVFEPANAEWRGIGLIPGSGLTIRSDYAAYDATKRFSIPSFSDKEPKGCKCGEILLGLRMPVQCPLFAKGCTPQKPVGPCMVSSEGSCAAEYKYGTTRKKL
jgi:hydrogenase expression/formation protein HypD